MVKFDRSGKQKKFSQTWRILSFLKYTEMLTLIYIRTLLTQITEYSSGGFVS